MSETTAELLQDTGFVVVKRGQVEVKVRWYELKGNFDVS